MLEHKTKKNKFHLPEAEEPAVRSKLGKAISDHGLIPDVAAADASPREEEPASSEMSAGNKNRFHLVVVPDAPETPQRNWEVYYRNRDYAGNVGDPLLAVVDADSQIEAEDKARYLQRGEGGVLAVSTNNPVIRKPPESQFAYPKPKHADDPRPPVQ